MDAAKTKEFVAVKGKDPEIIVKNDDYVVPHRDKGRLNKLKADKTIGQVQVTAGSFKDITAAINSYEISLPNGIIAANLSFTQGNNA